MNTDTCPWCGTKVITTLYSQHVSSVCTGYTCDVCGFVLTGWRLKSYAPTQVAGHLTQVRHVTAAAFRDLPDVIGPGYAMMAAKLAQGIVGATLSDGGLRFTWPTVDVNGTKENGGWGVVRPAFLVPWFRAVGNWWRKDSYDAARHIQAEIRECMKQGKLTPAAQEVVKQWGSK